MNPDYFLHIQLPAFDVSSQQSKPESEHLKNQKIQRYEIELFYQQIVQKDRELLICRRQIQELLDCLYARDQKIRFLEERLFEAQDDMDNRSLADLLDMSEEYE